jgi:hypothetical protein
LVSWTGKRDEAGNVGGVLDYRWFGVSTIFHVENQGLVAVYSFPDMTSYLIVAIITINLLALIISNYHNRLRSYGARVRNMTILSVLIALVALWACRGTMMAIESALKNSIYDPNIGGGIVEAGFPSFFFVYNVYEGQAVNKPEKILLDFTLPLLIVLAFIPIIIMHVTRLSQVAQADSDLTGTQEVWDERTNINSKTRSQSTASF